MSISNFRKTSFVTLLSGIGALWLTPLVLLIEKPTLIIFSIPYLVVSIFLVSISVITISRLKKMPAESYLARVIIFLTLLIPFLIISTYPFSLVNFFLVLIFFILGISLPFLSKYLTWWFYTLGSLLPLPQDHNWLIGEKNLKDPGRKYFSFIKSAVSLSTTVGLFGLYLIWQQPVSMIILLMQILSILVIFGFSLAVGVGLKKQRL